MILFLNAILSAHVIQPKNNGNSEARDFRKIVQCSPLIHCYTLPFVIPPNIVQSSSSFYHPLVYCYAVHGDPPQSHHTIPALQPKISH
jgi:hypothetical protein